MRIIACGVAAFALSGCSWLGLGQSKDHTYHSNQSYGTYGHSNASHAKKADDCCVGGRALSTFNAEFGGGASFNAGGDVFKGSNTHDGFAAADYQDVSYDSAYKTGYSANLGGSYALNPNRKVTGNVYYTEHDGKDVSFGSRTNQDIRGEFSDYKEMGIEAGLRQYVTPVRVPLLKSVRPYVEGRLGAAYVDDISINNLRSDDGNVAIDSLGLYNSGWVPTAAGLVGVETPLFNRMTVGVETGLRYTGRQSGNGDDINANFREFAGANNGNGRYSIPLTLRGRYRF